MHPALRVFFLAAVVARLASLWVSRRNERRLRELGAEEHGAGVSNALAGLHTFFYLGCALEGTLRHAGPDAASVVGMAVYALAMAVLAAVVASLRGLWTVRLYLAPEHRLHRGWIFRTFRHPNYLLNLVPELLGMALALHGWVTLAFLGPAYALALRARVREEERVMAQRFPEYGGG